MVGVGGRGVGDAGGLARKVGPRVGRGYWKLGVSVAVTVVGVGFWGGSVVEAGAMVGVFSTGGCVGARVGSARVGIDVGGGGGRVFAGGLVG